jgi:hypothetical protein
MLPAATVDGYGIYHCTIDYRLGLGNANFMRKMLAKRPGEEPKSPREVRILPYW